MSAQNLAAADPLAWIGMFRQTIWPMRTYGRMFPALRWPRVAGRMLELATRVERGEPVDLAALADLIDETWAAYIHHPDVEHWLWEWELGAFAQLYLAASQRFDEWYSGQALTARTGQNREAPWACPRVRVTDDRRAAAMAWAPAITDAIAALGDDMVADAARPLPRARKLLDALDAVRKGEAVSPAVLADRIDGAWDELAARSDEKTGWQMQFDDVFEPRWAQAVDAFDAWHEKSVEH